MKKRILLLGATCLVLSLLASCSGGNEEAGCVLGYS